MLNLLPLILPLILIGIIFLLIIKSEINKKFGRQFARTFVGIFVIAYSINNKTILLGLLSLVMLFLLFISERSLFFKKMVEEKERKSGKLTGLILYLSMIILTTILFPLWIAGCCLINLSFADGFATFVGKKGRSKLMWNKKKTFEGSITFLFVSFLGCFLVMSFLSPFTLDRIILFSLITSLIASFAESLPIKIDDNITVPLVTGAALYLLTILF